MNTATAAQLKSIVSRYDGLATDYHSCRGAKELAHWVMAVERAIDEAVKVLDKGVSKANARHREAISAGYHRLEALKTQATAKLGDIANGPI